MKIVSARRDGVCAVCEGGYDKGEPVSYWWGDYIHEDCRMDQSVVVHTRRTLIGVSSGSPSSRGT